MKHQPNEHNWDLFKSPRMEVEEAEARTRALVEKHQAEKAESSKAEQKTPVRELKPRTLPGPV